MNKQEVVQKARSYEGKGRNALAGLWKAACAKSGMSPRDFRYEVTTLRNVLDGRCPDGCCGNEDRPDWQPTPGEWVVLAESAAERFPVPPAQRTSGRPARTGSWR